MSNKVWCRCAISLQIRTRDPDSFPWGSDPWSLHQPNPDTAASSIYICIDWDPAADHYSYPDRNKDIVIWNLLKRRGELKQNYMKLGKESKANTFSEMVLYGKKHNHTTVVRGQSSLLKPIKVWTLNQFPESISSFIIIFPINQYRKESVMCQDQGYGSGSGCFWSDPLYKNTLIRI